MQHTDIHQRGLSRIILFSIHRIFTLIFSLKMADVRCADIEKTCVADLRFLLCLDAAKKIGVMRTSWLDLEFEFIGAINHARNGLELYGDLASMSILGFADPKGSKHLYESDVDTRVREKAASTRSPSVAKREITGVRLVEWRQVPLGFVSVRI
jgi:hypothetical protein